MELRSSSASTSCASGAGRAAGRRLGVRALAGALGGGAIAFTLMACYGAPPCPDGTRNCYKAPPPAASEGDAGSTPLAGDGGT
ncbi:MAG TPA: hypothetical protein VM925_21445 [Labilithrix sp.]|nr:hypothetical protein [Labilithrix sp.]